MPMPAAPPVDLLDRHMTRGLQAIPYFGLAISTFVTFVAREPYWPDVRIAVAVSVVALVWMLWMFTLHPGWDARPVLRVVAYAGLLGFAAVLVGLSPWYGFFAFSGYLYLEYLPGRWRAFGVVATAMIAAASQIGGPSSLRHLTAPVLLLWGGVAVFNIALAGGMLLVGWITNVRNEQRKQALAELTDANRLLEEAMEENAGLHAQLLVQAREAGITDERQRMAREIHDTLAQGLAGIITQVQAAQRSAERPETWRRHLDTAAKLARDSLAEARRTVHAVRPEALEHARLPEAIADTAVQWSAMHGVRADVTTTGDARPLHPAVETALLRTTQEALANVAKHAAASRVGLTLSYMEDVVTLDVRDDGVGFDPALPCRSDGEGGFGLTAMRQRMRRLTGRLDIESEPGGGTAISASVPAVPVGGAG
ncbi:MAG TPA: sensor histidine kinase [Streptosporangiaceae bacterium]|jgi:signal transduction histidine kinase